MVTSATIVAFSTASALAQVVFRTTQVTGFTVVQGVVSSPRNVVERLQGALWQFNPDGTLIFAPANSRTDLYPLTVNYQAQGNTVFFSGGRSINIGGTGLALAEIVGNVDFSSSTPIMTLRWISGTSNSFVGIGGQSHQVTPMFMMPN